jgi:dihydrodipicolinate synthase/N-acetylneuraminate lyase
MEPCTAPRGLIIELITPFGSGGGIDREGLKRLLARVSPFAQGVFLAGPRAGQGTRLPPDLRGDLLKLAILAMDPENPIPILIWATQESEEETRETLLALGEVFRERPYRAGIFYVDTPLYYHSNRGLPDLYREICPTVDAPLILHNDPDLIGGLARPLKRTNIRTAILKELAAFEGVSGMIFSGSLDRAHHYQKACRQRPDFRIYDGDEARFLDYPSRSGVVSQGATLAPAAWQKIVRSSLRPSTEGTEYPDRLRQIWETGEILRRIKDLYAEAPAPTIKDVLAEMGIIGRPEPAPGYSGDTRALLKELEALKFTG